MCHVPALAGVELEPKVWVTVDVDAEKGTVSFRRCVSTFLSCQVKEAHPAEPRQDDPTITRNRLL